MLSLVLIALLGFVACNQQKESTSHQLSAEPVGIHLNDANDILLEYASASDWALVGATMVRNYDPNDDARTILENFDPKAFRYHFQVDEIDVWIDLLREKNSLISSAQVYCSDPERKDLEELGQLFGEDVPISITDGVPPNQESSPQKN
jgi:hypothetical protein